MYNRRFIYIYIYIYESEIAGADVSFTGKSIDYDIAAGTGASIDGNAIIVTESNATVTLTFEGMENAETYCYITGLSYTGTSPVERYTDLQWDLLSTYEQNEVYYSEKYYEDSTSLSISLTAKNTEGASASKTLTYYTPRYTWYSNREDFMVNLGYDEQSKVSVTIKFPAIGTYSFDSMEILCQPMENYPAQISALAETVMQDVDFHENAAYATNTVTGTITLDAPKFLLLTIPYANGWTAYVDGVEQEILQANTCYMALFLEEGAHSIELVYRTPGLAIGCALSFSAAVAFVVMLIYGERKRKLST